MRQRFGTPSPFLVDVVYLLLYAYFVGFFCCELRHKGIRNWLCTFIWPGNYIPEDLRADKWQILALFTITSPIISTAKLIHSGRIDFIGSLRRFPRKARDEFIFLVTGRKNPLHPLHTPMHIESSSLPIYTPTSDQLHTHPDVLGLERCRSAPSLPIIRTWPDTSSYLVNESELPAPCYLVVKRSEILVSGLRCDKCSGFLTVIPQSPQNDLGSPTFESMLTPMVTSVPAFGGLSTTVERL